MTRTLGNKIIPMNKQTCPAVTPLVRRAFVPTSTGDATVEDRARKAAKKIAARPKSRFQDEGWISL